MNQQKVLRKISVVVPVYNVEKYCEATIKSLLKQNYPNYELILVDDGSSDNSGKICDKYAADNVIVIHQANKGVSAARNVGIDMATGTYLAFVDGDDIVDKDYIYSLYHDLVNEDADLAVQIYVNLFPDGEKNSVSEHLNYVMTSENFVDFEIIQGRDTSSCVKLFRKDIIEKNAIRFDTDIYNLEDTLFLFQYCRHIKKVKYNTVAHYYRTIRNDGVVFSKFNTKKLTALRALDKIEDLLMNGKVWKRQEKFIKGIKTIKFQQILFFMETSYRDIQDKSVYNDLKKEAGVMVSSGMKRSLPFKQLLKYYLLSLVPSMYLKIKPILKKGY